MIETRAMMTKFLPLLWWDFPLHHWHLFFLAATEARRDIRDEEKEKERTYNMKQNDKEQSYNEVQWTRMKNRLFGFPWYQRLHVSEYQWLRNFKRAQLLLSSAIGLFGTVETECWARWSSGLISKAHPMFSTDYVDTWHICPSCVNCIRVGCLNQQGFDKSTPL